ncbi:Type II/IV secretion system secretin RcpA/CpaC, associated with Flp pilus assembly [Rhodovulum sp. P5]|nr:Type II/IV secretion system secretin RcpA/CpaC, associated with Flp pilus assembly [Rhodovulum sp. P5]
MLAAGLVGLCAAFAQPSSPEAQALRTMGATSSGKLNVPVNRAVIVESEEIFAELSISNPAIADISTLSDRSIYVLGKAPGRTTLTLLGAEGQLLANVEVRVTLDISELKERLREILPGEPVEVRAANDGLVLSGTVSSPQVIDRAMGLAERYAPKKVSNMMSVAGSQQVMLNVRFAEMNRSVAKSLGANFGVSGQVDGGDTTFQANALTTAATGAGIFQIGGQAGVMQFNLLLEAMETKGFIRTLAEPNLTALSGHNASFLAGGDYPIPVLGQDGNVSVEFRPFGVSLDFMPNVVGENINLQMEAEVSNIDPSVTFSSGGLTISGFSSRKTETTIELHDGESFAIAGLLQDDFTSLATQVPWIGDVPVLGALFRSADYQRDQSELVIIVTAHLVTPTRGEALALPTDRLRPASERDFFLFGRMGTPNAPTQGAAGEIARQDFRGPYGYVME